MANLKYQQGSYYINVASSMNADCHVCCRIVPSLVSGDISRQNAELYIILVSHLLSYRTATSRSGKRRRGFRLPYDVISDLHFLLSPETCRIFLKFTQIAVKTCLNICKYTNNTHYLQESCFNSLDQEMFNLLM